jgi:hypothetical protein
MYICNNWYVLYVLVDCRRTWLPSSIPTRPANNQLKRTIRTNVRTYTYIYILLPPDDGQLASPKHVEP